MSKYSPKRQISSLNNYDFSTKSQGEVAKYVSKKLDMLGYKVPKYMQQGKINQKQLDRHLNRIYNKLEKQVEKENFQKLSKAEQNLIRKQNRLERLVVEHNKEVKKIHDYIDKNYTSNKIREYLKGTMFSTKSDKAFFRDFTPSFVDLENWVYSSLDSAINQIKNDIRKNTLDNFINSLDDTKSNKWVLDMIEREDLFTLTDLDKENILSMFNNLDSPNKEIMIKDFLRDIKEKYERLKEELGDDYDGLITGSHIFNKFYTGVNSYRDI